MTLKDFFGFGDTRPVEPVVLSGVRVQPIVVQAGQAPTNAEEQAQRDLYRVDAITRHINQSKTISAQRMREFGAEIRERALRLLNSGHITEDQHDALLIPFRGR